jgi:hypothetical protein
VQATAPRHPDRRADRTDDYVNHRPSLAAAGVLGSKCIVSQVASPILMEWGAVRIEGQVLLDFRNGGIGHLAGPDGVYDLTTAAAAIEMPVPAGTWIAAILERTDTGFAVEAGA